MSNISKFFNTNISKFFSTNLISNFNVILIQLSILPGVILFFSNFSNDEIIDIEYSKLVYSLVVIMIISKVVSSNIHKWNKFTINKIKKKKESQDDNLKNILMNKKFQLILYPLLICITLWIIINILYISKNVSNNNITYFDLIIIYLNNIIIMLTSYHLYDYLTE
jgi:hypothetical protein